MNYLVTGFLALWLLTPPSSAAFAAPPAPLVKIHDGMLSVQAGGGSLHEILKRLNELDGVTITGMQKVKERKVGEGFKDLSFEKGLSRILYDHNYVLLVNQAKGTNKVIILGKKTPEKESKPGASSSQTEKGTKPLRVSGKHGPGTGAETIMELDRTNTPERRVELLRSFGNRPNDQQSMKVLHSALFSESSEERLAALEAMRYGTVNDDLAVLRDVRHIAATDPDPTIKYSALEVLVRYDHSVEAGQVLDAIATEGEGPLSDLAKQEIERMKKEAAAAALPDPQTGDNL